MTSKTRVYVTPHKLTSHLVVDDVVQSIITHHYETTDKAILENMPTNLLEDLVSKAQIELCRRK